MRGVEGRSSRGVTCGGGRRQGHHLGQLQHHRREEPQAAAAGDGAAAAAFHAAHGTSVFLFTLGLLFLTVAATALAWVLHADVLGPRWASTLGLVGMPFAALLTFIALLLPDPARLVVGVGAMLLLVAWIGILALALLREGRGWVAPPLPTQANP